MTRRVRPKATRKRLNLTIPMNLWELLHGWIDEGRYDHASDYLRRKIRHEAGMDRPQEQEH
jgi:Arc/MetJ-type ribon-helix-helix transcriptional regulator